MTLRLHIASAAGEPPYKQLVRQLKKALAARSLKPGERMTSVRVLARELGVSPNTVARAYRELEREREKLRPLADKLVAEGRLLGLSSTEIRSVVFGALAERRGQ
jgi:DNA-binding transcriptional regulator YhcF (GntR family)